jgi:hypothetical protein
MNGEAWVREAKRLHGRYLVEVVEHYGLCPWAVKARTTGRLRTTVLLQTDETSVQPSLEAMDPWVGDAAMEVGFLLYPRLELDRAAFESFTAAVRTAEIARYPLGSAPFAMVAFHPEGRAELADAERLIPFLRRTPDPCIQVVRAEVLDRVRGGTPEGTQFFDSSVIDVLATGGPPEPTVRERVSRTNLATVRSVGVDDVRATLDALRRDRDETYRELLTAAE